MKKNELVILCLLFTVGFLARLYKVESPLADWHSWRQVDTSAVSRSFINQGFDILHPKFHDLSNVPSGLDNPQGYRFVEFPLYNMAQAGLSSAFGTFKLEMWGRLVSILASLFSAVFLYLLVKKHSDSVSAFFSVFFFLLMPFNIYFNRSVLPETSMVACMLAATFFMDLWVDKKSKMHNFHFLASLVLTSAALLLKPYAIFFILPMFFLTWKKFGIKMFTNWQLWLFAFLAIIPLVLWRIWMVQYPSGIPVSDWLFNGGGIRFKGAFFYWLFADRLGRLILGYWGLALFIIGILVNSGREHMKNNGGIFYMFLLSSILYMTVFARGNVQHDYYQILIIPSVTIFLGLGARAMLFPNPEYINKTISRILLFIVVIFSLGFGWYFVRDFYNINNGSIIIAGNQADKILPKDARVIAPYEGDTTFLYYTNRNGWASFQNPLPEMIEKGATHLILVNPTEKDYDIGKEYKIISQAKEYLIFDLLSTQ